MSRTKNTVAIATLLVAMASCQRSEEVSPTRIPSEVKTAYKKFHGATRSLGHGTVRAWTRFNGDVPIEVGVDISEQAMNSLPHDHVMLSLPFHPVKNSGTFTHMLVDWAPHGHEPIFYEVPHFDVHFYTQEEADRLAIGMGDEAEMETYPAPQYLPEDHIPAGGVPQMGVHWVDLLSPELNGEPFTRTFIYGTYDGRVTFYEPMITREWLIQQSNTVVPIPQPQAFQEDGHYPTEYRVTHTEDPGTYSIAMALEYRSGQ